MPCRSDYMEPTEREKKAWAVWREDAQSLADRLVYSTDVLREHILAGNSDEVRPILSHVDKSNYYRDEVKKLQDRYKKLYLAPAKYDEYNKRLPNLLGDYTAVDRIVVKGEKLEKDVLASIEKDQSVHREEDLRRLMKVFAESGDRQRLKKVLDADNTKPLEPQLGFSPDDF